MTKSLLRMLAAAALFSTFLVGCGGKQEVEEGPRYEIPAGWLTYTYENIKIIYPPGHLHAASIHDFAVWYNWALRTDCQFLNIRIPVDTLIVFYYTGHGQGNEMTGHYYPWADRDVIHFWLPSHKGPTLMQFLLPYWLDKEPQYQFLKHGLITLLDYSGQNYHEITWRYYQNDSLIPLVELSRDTTVDSNKERWQSALSASFVDFLALSYGLQGLNLMYRAEADWELATQGIFRIPADTLQARWLEFVEKVVKGEWPPVQPDTTKSRSFEFDPGSEG